MIENYYEFGNKEQPKQLIFLLHGLGSNGQDLISLAPLWAKSLPNALFISPDAPFPCDMAPMGYQWFSLQSRDPADMRRGIEIAFPLLTEFMKSQCDRFGLSLSECALVGFSQGTMMSLFTGPRLGSSVAGVLGYSGALLGEDLFLSDQSYQKPPVCLIHGQADDVVPVEASVHARQVLEGAGFQVSGHTTPGLAHGIDEAGIAAGNQFLKGLF